MSNMPEGQTTESKQSNEPNEPRITYIGKRAEPTKKKNPNRVAAGKRAALRKEKLRLLKKESSTQTVEDDCKSSAINVAYIAGIFGIVTGAIAVYRWFFPGKDKDIPELQPAVLCVEKVADEPLNPGPKPDIISLG